MSIDLFGKQTKTTSPSKIQDAADLIIHYLENIGVTHVFGVPGGAIEPFYNGLARSTRRGGLQAVGACHESAAAYMADGYQRESGKLGVCVATSGPGATNLITGVACAHDNNIPMLVITGQPTIASFGKGALQEGACTGVNVIGMFRHCTKYNSLVSHIDQLETKLANAILRAHQSPQGPVHLSIPVDILRSPLAGKAELYDLNKQLALQNSACDEQGVAELLEELRSAHQPLFFIGSGTSEAIDKIMQLVELCDARFVTTPDAKGLINIRHKAYRGVFGLGGHSSAMYGIELNKSIAVAFGTGFGEFLSAGWNKALLNNKLIHVDASINHLLQTPMAKLHVQGPIAKICEKILDKLRLERGPVSDNNTNYFPKVNPMVVLEEPSKYQSNAIPIKPQRLMKELSENFPSSTRFVVDAGNSMMWAPHYLQPNNARKTHLSCEPNQLPFGERRNHSANWLRLTLNFAPMGWAIGAAVGVARANQSGPVVCITGDGSYLMSGQEITVAAREKLPVVFVILNDGVYGMVMHGQRLAGAEPIGFELPVIDFAKMAEAMGIANFTIKSPSDFEQLQQQQIANLSGPLLLDVRIDREEVPPMIMRLKSLGTAQQESMAS
ncbi:acetolactate synthase-1/2/3 large subunit [Alteromonadaceae bacterium 2753L.S.0a.02]|nr:acetolactate synthase-1/2/3 large subunit [Alteromonadaceae bacterium 2753L.S.0a.02]